MRPLSSKNALPFSQAICCTDLLPRSFRSRASLGEFHAKWSLLQEQNAQQVLETGGFVGIFFLRLPVVYLSL